MRRILIAAAALMAFSTSAAVAETYDWTFIGDKGGAAFTSSGSFAETSGLITSWTGTWDGATITGLLPVGSIGDNDNLYPLDNFGVSFSTTPLPTTGDTNVNLFNVSGSNFAWFGSSGSGSDFNTTFTATPVPELSTWAMGLAGFAGLGFLGYRRKQIAAPALA